MRRRFPCTHRRDMGQQEKAFTRRILVVVLTSVKSTCPVKVVANSSTSSASGETRSTGSQWATEEESMDASRAATAADMVVCRLQEEGSMLMKESRIWVWVLEILAFPMDVVTKLQDMELVLVWVPITEARTT
jgi:hypothetical protein